MKLIVLLLLLTLAATTLAYPIASSTALDDDIPKINTSTILFDEETIGTKLQDSSDIIDRLNAITHLKLPRGLTRDDNAIGRSLKDDICSTINCPKATGSLDEAIALLFKDRTSSELLRARSEAETCNDGNFYEQYHASPSHRILQHRRRKRDS